MASPTSAVALTKDAPPVPTAPHRAGGPHKHTASPPSLRASILSDGWQDLIVPIAVLGIVLAMVMPIPGFLLDVLISANITLSVVILLASMYIRRPVELSVFPTTLLLMTLFRLALNVSSSRLILLEGNSGTAAAGHVIEAFGNFVVGGNYVIGVVIFLVLIAIQFVVINHGAVRISEVTARFTLDAMPGKQMSIDSDLNAGLIDESEARRRRKDLAQEAEFYGAMDGATRFTQRDALASILITTLNIAAGFLIGVLQHGMELKKALTTYTVLTIGDGLVTVIPALIISVCGGLIVTRASSDAKLGTDFQKQLFGNHRPLLLGSAVLVLMSIFPGMPTLPFLVLGSGLGAVGWRIRKKEAEEAPTVDQAPPPQVKESIETLLKVEPLAVEVGLGLVKLVEGGGNSPLLRRIGAIRKQLATELGYILPPVRVTDNLSLRAREYVVYLKGAEIGRYELPLGMELAIPPATVTQKIEGIETKDPAFGIPAVWISSDQTARASSLGYTIVDTVSVLGTHLTEIVRRNAHELYTRQDAKKLLDRVAEENARLVEDLVPKLLPLAVVQRILQNLLRERVSIRDANSILEALGEAANITKNPTLLTEYVRQTVRRLLVRPYLNAKGELAAYTLDGALERMVEETIEHTENSSHLTLAPQKIRLIIDKIQAVLGSCENPAVMVCSTGGRFFLRQITEGTFPNLTVISHSEIPSGIRVLVLANIQ